jgi:hypothetical protein
MVRTNSLAIAALLGIACAVTSQAGDIEGAVIIKRKLTKRRVTAPVSL